MCVNANTRRFLVNAVSMLVIDVVLLISMLVGLVRFPHSSSFGLWHVLFQQVVPYFPSPLSADISEVHHLAGPGNDFGSSPYGLPISATLQPPCSRRRFLDLPNPQFE
jgi:hypothetical protein